MKLQYSVGNKVITSSGEVKLILSTFGDSGYYLCQEKLFDHLRNKVEYDRIRPNKLSVYGVKLYRYFQILPYNAKFAEEVELRRQKLEAAHAEYTDARGRLLMLFHKKRNQLEEANEPKTKIRH